MQIASALSNGTEITHNTALVEPISSTGCSRPVTCKSRDNCQYIQRKRNTAGADHQSPDQCGHANTYALVEPLPHPYMIDNLILS